MNARCYLRQTRHIDLRRGRNAIFIVGQLRDPLNQVYQAQLGVQSRDVRAALYRQQLAQHHSGCAAGQLQCLQAGNRCRPAQGAARVKHIDGGLDQLTDRNGGGQYIVVAHSRYVEVGLETVQVVQKAYIGTGDALPIGDAEVERAAQQAADDRVQNGCTGAVHCHRGAANGQRRQWRSTHGDRRGAECDVRRRRRAVEQCTDTRCNASWHRVCRDHLNGLSLGGISNKYAFAQKAESQGAAPGHKSPAIGIRRKTVAGGALVGEFRGCGRAATGASASGSFQRRDVRDALQRALLQIQPAAVHYHQRAQQRQAQCQRRHQADCATLSGGCRCVMNQVGHQHSFDNAVAHSPASGSVVNASKEQWQSAGFANECPVARAPSG
ncbi:hypothetical protein ALP71_05777 [Pseudomonas coronafaciens pv. garcae]|nr:hypothetical protein ALP71_05777 [Pseudomonas coronafaciens pv. garcae]